MQTFEDEVVILFVVLDIAWVWLQPDYIRASNLSWTLIQVHKTFSTQEVTYSGILSNYADWL